MLVLARKPGQRTLIRINGELVWLKIVEVRNDTVRLGFEAARGVDILREELLFAAPETEPISA